MDSNSDNCFLFVLDSGISLEAGILVASVMPGSPAAKEGSLTVGDRVVAVSINPFLIHNAAFS